MSKYQNRARAAASPIRQFCGTQRPPECTVARASSLPVPCSSSLSLSLSLSARLALFSVRTRPALARRRISLPSHPAGARPAPSLCPGDSRGPDGLEMRPHVVGEAHPGLLAARGLGLRGGVNVLARPDLTLERVEHLARHDGRRAAARRPRRRRARAAPANHATSAGRSRMSAITTSAPRPSSARSPARSVAACDALCSRAMCDAPT